MSNYWLKRAIADEAIAHQAAEEVSAKIQKIYQRNYEQVIVNLERLYAEAKTDGTLTRTQLWNYTRWKAIESKLSAFSTNASKQTVSLITQTLNGVFNDVIGVDISSLTGNKVHIVGDPTTAVNTAWSGECFSSRVWNSTAAVAQHIKTDIEDMMVGGRSLREVRRKVMDDFSAGYSDAQRLVHTESAYVANNAAKQRYAKAGLKKIRWCTAPEDGRECSICQERANKVWTIETAPAMPAHPRCRCVWQGVVELEGEEVPCTGELM